MTAIDPLTSGFTTSPTTTREPTDQFGKDTFLKLLVAQLKYQNPLAPKDGSEFLSQTAQFTMVEKLTAIEEQSKQSAAANEVLQAATMVGKSITAALNPKGLPSATSEMTIGGNLPAGAALGTRHEMPAEAYLADGTKVPLRIRFEKMDRPGVANAWDAVVYAGEQRVGGPFAVDFDAQGQRTTPDPQLTIAMLERVANTNGKWNPSGIKLELGGTGDAGRLRSGDGSATVALREQNGTDGQTVTGVVTGVKFDIAGPLLIIGSREVPMLDVMQVRLPVT